MKLAILGGGSAGLGVAGYVALKEHEVNIYNRTPERVAEIAKSGSLTVSGVVEGTVTVHKASSDMEDIVEEAEYILIAARAFGHRTLIERCLPYIKNNAAIVVFTGYWAALRLQSLLTTEKREDITIAETTLLPLISQTVGPDHVKITGIKSKMRIAAYPAPATLPVHEELKEIFPNLFPGKNVLETSLENFNPVVHVPIALFNLAQIERRGETFEFYQEGISPKIADTIDAVDRERMDLIHTFDLELMSFREILLDYYETEGTSTYEVVKNCEPMKGYVLPSPLEYVQEDLLYGLVPIVSLCNSLGIPAETAKALISTWSLVNAENYWKKGVKAVDLGVENMDSREIRKKVEEG